MAASFDSYKVFYFVAKYGNITRAASALFLAQSTVTRSIQSLESELGCKLFRRNQRGVTLTGEGEVLFRHISVGCEAFLEGEARLQQLISANNNELRICVNDFIYQQYLIPALTEFSKLCPEVRVSVSTQRNADTEGIYSSLKDGIFDILFVFAPLPEDNMIKVLSAGEVKDVLIAGNAFSTFRDRQVSFVDLKDSPFVVRSVADGSVSYLEEVFERHGVSVHPRYHVDTITHYIPMVRAGLCIAMLPESVFEKADGTEGLFKLQLSAPLPTRTVCIVTSKSKPLSAAGEELIRCFRHQTGD